MANWPPQLRPAVQRASGNLGRRLPSPRGAWGWTGTAIPRQRMNPAPAGRAAGRSPRRPARPSTRPRHSPGSCHLDRGHGPRSGPRYSRRPSRSTACSACRDNRYRRGSVAASHHSTRSGIRGGIDARRPARSKHLIVVLVRLRLHLLILDQERG